MRKILVAGSTLSLMAAPVHGRGLPAESAAPPAKRGADLVEERSIDELRRLLETRRTTSAALVRAYLDRIKRLDRSGPTLRSVIAVSPDAMAQAAEADRERRAGRIRGPLHGLPVLVKDNIETAGPLPTTAGSLALVANVSGRDAVVVARLRAAGAIILGKTNLSEWANIRSSRSSSGWSAVGGLTRNPYVLDRNTCGSSSGSAAAAAASLAPATVGTETDGSITCPSAMSGLVGLKPTVGLISRTGVVPISRSQDSPGPMGRSVMDVALLLGAMVGSDPADPATRDADRRVADYAGAVRGASLKGVRLGVLRSAVGSDPKLAARFERALDELRAAGAVLVDVDLGIDGGKLASGELKVLLTELKDGLDRYLENTPPAVRTRSLRQVIEFNREHAPRELAWFGQDLFERAQETRGLDDPDYRAALETGRRLAGREGIDEALREFRLAALVAPTTGPAWPTDLVNGDHFGDAGAGRYAAVAGYPHLTVPMGDVDGLPVGLSLIGTAWSEAALLTIGAAFERSHGQRTAPRFIPSVTDPGLSGRSG